MENLITKPIVLVGIMGSGKSTVGKKLAHKLGLKFYDTDRAIEEREGLSIVEIYDFRGKEYFQKKEVEIIKEFLSYGVVVIATGGETFIRPELHELIKKHTISVWISADKKILYERISRRDTRPAFNCENKMKVLDTMLEKYNPIYADADITIENHSFDTHHIIDTLIMRLKKYLRDN